MICKLALEDGTVFSGTGFGAHGTHTGEVVFNTSMTGYQEVISDPSYCAQIVTMTFPLIGNVGVNAQDRESLLPHLSGFVIKELSPRPSRFSSRTSRTCARSSAGSCLRNYGPSLIRSTWCSPWSATCSSPFARAACASHPSLSCVPF